MLLRMNNEFQAIGIVFLKFGPVSSNNRNEAKRYMRLNGLILIICWIFIVKICDAGTFGTGTDCSHKFHILK